MVRVGFLYWVQETDPRSSQVLSFIRKEDGSMDQVRWVIYWIGFIPLAFAVVIFGGITLAILGALFVWQWAFEEAPAEEIQEHSLRSPQASH